MARRPTARSTAARQKTTRVPAALPNGDSAPERWLANIRMSGFTIMMLCLLVLAVVVLAPSLKLLVQQDQQIAGLEKSVADQKSRVTDLKGQVARWDDPAYIETQARNRLLFVFPGEYSYLVIPDGATTATQGGVPISKSLQTTRVDWVKSLTSSLLTAGLSKKTAATINSPVIGGGTPATGAAQ
jgi:cell division protein FtsB